MSFLNLKKSCEKNNPYSSDPDVKLMLEFKDGNKASFEALMQTYFPRVLNFIYRFVGNRELAEDLTQEVFIKVYQNAANYKPQAKFQTWLYTIAKNISLNELRRHKGRMVSLDETFETDGNEVKYQFEDTKMANPKEELLLKERQEIIKAAIHSLPENQRMAVLLRRYDNFAYEEIAKTMNTSVKAVKSLLNRAKENLKEKLANVMESI